MYVVDLMPGPLAALVYRWREQRAPESVGFDEAHGTETASFDWFGNYEPTRPTVVDEVLDALRIDWPRWTFVDLGSGKGRVLLVAARRPFARVVGIEASARLHQVARANLAAVGPTVAPVHLFHADVRDAPVPSGPLVLFLYNPFGADVLVDVLGRLGARPLLVVYVNPVHAAVVEQASFAQVARGRPGEVQHWRIYRRG
jgi:SAM-dependent methyltransferase